MWICCHKCLVYGPASSTPEEASLAWNRMTDRNGVLSLREQAAVAALRGILSNPDRKAGDPSMVARWAVQHADALVEELAKPLGK